VLVMIGMKMMTLLKCERRAELHYCDHVESDVHQAGVKKHRGDRSPPLIFKENGGTKACPKAVLRFTDQSPQYGQTASLAGGGEGKPTHAEHQNVGDEQGGGGGSLVLAE